MFKICLVGIKHMKIRIKYGAMTLCFTDPIGEKGEMVYHI